MTDHRLTDPLGFIDDTWETIKSSLTPDCAALGEEGGEAGVEMKPWLAGVCGVLMLMAGQES